MKIAKTILFTAIGLVVLGIIVFVAIGMISPTTTYTNSITVNRSPGFAWRVFQDTAYMDQWLQGMQSIETVEGEPMTEGSVYKLTFLMEGELMEMTEVVTKVDSARTFAFDLDSDIVTSSNRITFTPVDSTTTDISSVSTAKGKGIFWKSLISVSGSMMEQEGQKSYDALKELIESLPDSL